MNFTVIWQSRMTSSPTFTSVVTLWAVGRWQLLDHTQGPQKYGFTDINSFSTVYVSVPARQNFEEKKKIIFANATPWQYRKT